MTTAHKTHPGDATADHLRNRLGELLAEMEDLVRILPGAAVDRAARPASPARPTPETRADAVARSEDEAIEAGFDNMPL